MQFSDTANRTGLVQLLEDLTSTASGTTSSYTLATKTRDINNAFAHFMLKAISASGKWQIDDTNQTDYPILKIDLVSGQQDYSFTSDGSTPANQILDISRVECADADGNFSVLDPFDQTDETASLKELSDISGNPRRYDKLANGIWLDPKPDFSLVEGLRVYYNRTPSYFTTADTTKSAGIPQMFHEYLAVRPAYLFVLSKNLPQIVGYRDLMLSLEKKIDDYYAARNKDEHTTIKNKYVNAW
jgi:hypothetical protein